MLSPLTFRRSQEISITSFLQLQCNGSLATSQRWTVTRCTPTCSSAALQLPPSVTTTLSELFLPPRTLDYGTYQLTLRVSMSVAPQWTSSASAYVIITPSPITPHLLPLGTSMITHGHGQDLLLDPGTYSVDPDALTFNASVSILFCISTKSRLCAEILPLQNWKYDYYCRIYDGRAFPTLNGTLLTIDDPRNNASCLLTPPSASSRSYPLDSTHLPPCDHVDNAVAWQYGGGVASPKSSLTLVAGSFASNQTYQLMVQMQNRQNPCDLAVGYLVVRVEDSQPQLITIG